MKKTCLFVLAGIALASPLADAELPTEQVQTRSCLTPKHAGVPQATAEPSFGTALGWHVLWPLHLITLVPSNYYTAADQGTVQKLGDKIVASHWIHAALKDYVPAGQKATHTPIKAAAFTHAAPVLHADAIAYIEKEIAKNPKIKHTGHNLYMLFLPKGFQVVKAPGGKPAPGFHNELVGIANAKGDGWAAIQPDSKSFDRNTTSVIMSHELAEAVTDTGGTGYKLRHADKPTKEVVATESPWIVASSEVGDLCARARILDQDGELYERTFSNSAAAKGGDPCAPAASSPYFNTTPVPVGGPLPLGFVSWTRAKNGEADIKFRGWISGTSTECDLKWHIEAVAVDAKAADDDAGETKNKNQFTPVLPKNALASTELGNNGSGTLKVKIPAGTPAGHWGVVRIVSTPLEKPLGHDEEHNWYFGVYTE